MTQILNRNNSHLAFAMSNVDKIYVVQTTKEVEIEDKKLEKGKKK